MKNNTEIIIIDDVLKEDDPLIKVLRKKSEYKEIKLFTHSQDGLDYILKNLEKDFIVLLDIDFPGEKNGNQILSELRKENKLIPVIIWSAMDGSTGYDFTSFINNHALYYVKKDTSIKEIILRIDAAYHYLQLDVASAINRWLLLQEDKKQILSVDSTGIKYSAEDLITEIRKQTSEGRKIEKEIIELTIDLLFRKKVVI